MICLKNVIFTYDKNDLINNFSYRFNDYGLYGIKGSSGSGKTTLLNLIGGILEPQEGEILYSDDIKEYQKYISFIFQDNNLFEKLTVLQNINILAQMDKDKLNEEEIDAILDKLMILKYKNTIVSNLSGGERQRIAISVALIRGSKVIIADEPCASLDDNTAKEIMNIFKELSENHLIIISSHNQNMLNSYCDNIIEFPLSSNEIEAPLDLVAGVKGGISPSFKNFFRINNKVTSYKIGLKVLIICLLTLLIAALAAMISLYDYSKAEVSCSMIEYNNASDIFLSGDYDGFYDDKSLYYENIGISIQQFTNKTNVNNPYFGKTNAPIEKIVINNSLSDNEIIITDYTLFYLMCYDVITVDSLSQAIGKDLVIECFGIDYSLKIADIVETPIMESIYINAPLSYELNIDNMYGLFSYAFINKKTWFTLFQNNVELDYFDTVNNLECLLLSNDELIDNQATISQSLLDQISLQIGKIYSVGDDVEIEFGICDSDKSFTYKFEIKEISTCDRPLFMYSLDIFDFNVKYELSRFDRYIDGIFIRTADIDDLSSFFKNAYNNESVNVLFYGSTSVNSICGGVEAFKKLSLYFIIVVALIVLFCIIFFVSSAYKANDRSYKLLMIYGLKKSYILLLTLFNFLSAIIISITCGCIFAYFIGLGMDDVISSGMPKEVFSTYKFMYSIISAFFVCLITIIAILIGHFIISKRKQRSHIAI